MAAGAPVAGIRQLKQEPLNETGASQKKQSAPPPRDGDAVVIFPEINIPADLLPLMQPIFGVAATDVDVVKVVMHSLRSGIDWQFPLKLAC